MAVIQPLYFAGGRYTPGTDRKLTASMVSSTAGARTQGVVPSNIGSDALKVVPHSSRTIKIQTGLCFINDLASENTKTPGMYLAGIDTVEETLELTTNTTGSVRYDHIYAEVDETSYVITNKALTSNVATLTTSSAHGFAVGETVIITGVDDIFDGAHVLTTGTTGSTIKFAITHADVSSTVVDACVIEGTTVNTVNNKQLSSGTATLTLDATTGLATGDTVTVKGVDATFDGTYVITVSGSTITYKINKVTDNVSSTAVTASSVAKARVPFRVRAETLTSQTYTAPTTSTIKGILLAIVTKANGYTTITSGDIVDARIFSVPHGSVQPYYSSLDDAIEPGSEAGRLRYDLSTNTLELYNGSLWHEVSIDSHTHADLYRGTVFSSGTTLADPKSYKYGPAAPGTSLVFGSTTNIGSTLSFTCSAACFALVTIGAAASVTTSGNKAQVYFTASGATTIPAGSGSNSSSATDGTIIAGPLYATIGSDDVTNSATFLVKLSSGTTVFQIVGAQDDYSSGDAKVSEATISVIPLYAA